jgi:SAM-dependent methyltransferase
MRRLDSIGLFSRSATLKAYSLVPQGGGKRILEIGPGEGRDLRFLSGSGAQVTGIDISSRSLSISRDCCPVCDLSLMNGSILGFADSVFDVVFARTLLMHVDKRTFFKECRRVLKTGGKAIFVEPLKLNPLLLPYRAAFSPGRRVAPEYLKPEDLSGMRDIFGAVRTWYFYLFSAIGAPFTAVAPGARMLFVPLEWADRLLLRALPFLKHFCWISVIECTK